MSCKRVTKSYEKLQKLQKVTNELRKSYEKLQKVTKSYKRVIGSDLEASFCEILEKLLAHNDLVNKNIKKHKSTLRGS